MTSMSIEDPVLKRFRAALAEIHGNQIDRVVLFGSRARGDPRPDSDYDVAVFLRELPDRWREMDRLADIGSEILDDEGKFVSRDAILGRCIQRSDGCMRSGKTASI